MIFSESGLICVEYECQVIQLLLELALEVVTPPFTMSEHENESAGFLLITLSGSFVTYKKRVYNAAAVRVLLRFLLLFTPNVQLELLNFIEKLACANSLNKENLTSIGANLQILVCSNFSDFSSILSNFHANAARLCGTSLEIIHPLVSSSSSLVSHALKIVEVLGAYRLSVSELRSRQVYYVHEARELCSLCCLMMERMIVSEIRAQEMFLLTFFQNLLKPQARETEAPKAGSPKRHSLISGKLGAQVLRIFSVGSVDNESTFYTELCLHDDGVLTLATSNSSSLTFAGLEMEEGRWHHLAVVHSKPNALAGLFQASFAYVYLNGKLRHTGKLGYSPSPAGKSVQVTIGTPVACARVSDLSWKLRSCFLFEEVPTSMAILDSLDTDLPSPSNTQKPDTAGKQGIFKVDGSGFVWDSYKLGNLSLQLWGKKLILALDGTSTRQSEHLELYPWSI
ncbi:UNVERIFIED_CONTAM: protein SPIRRIG [Sesamum radiatum]|uniref:Protein SPIRRIG n=1 Tax=Sesamum radiatum TaxID=300843 RepID=A0AAW2W835_SESRA